jgi:hypothetical protein
VTRRLRAPSGVWPASLSECRPWTRAPSTMPALPTRPSIHLRTKHCLLRAAPPPRAVPRTACPNEAPSLSRALALAVDAPATFPPPDPALQPPPVDHVRADLERKLEQTGSVLTGRGPDASRRPNASRGSVVAISARGPQPKEATAKRRLLKRPPRHEQSRPKTRACPERGTRCRAAAGERQRPS